MTYVSALMPVLVVLAALLVARVPVWAAALLGFAAALGRPAVGSGVPVQWDAGAELLLNAALVVVPGLTLNGILERRGVHVRLAEWVRAVPLSAPWKTCLLVLGIGPALESLTGFGVSLLVTVPILMSLAPPAVALRQAVLGMAVVPWGALALPTVVGARLTGTLPSELGERTALLYLLLMPVVGGVATFLGREGTRPARAVLPGALCGTGQALVLLAANAAELTVLAGVLAGTAVAVAVLLPGLARRTVPAPPPRAVAPYATVLATVAAVQVLTRAGVHLDAGVPVGGGSIAPLTSPGLGLLVAVLVFVRRGTWGAAGRAARSSWRTVCALGGFVFMAQVMKDSGSFGVLTEDLPGTGTVLVSALSPAMALASGFLTGSATSGNALMMVPQDSLGTGALAPSIQNAGAGIAMLASLPTAGLALNVAGISDRRTERSLIGFDLRLLGVFEVLLGTCFAAVVLAAG